MMSQPSLVIRGEVSRPTIWQYDTLRQLPDPLQVADVSQLDPRRSGRAIKLRALLELAGVSEQAAFITLHAAADDFHASIPLAEVRDQAVVIYEQGDAPLTAKAGGPFRFLIPDHAACKTAEIDECANVKFIDTIELSIERGHDNRPAEERAHAELHRRQAEQQQ
jgi:DMSO/TMAO reductase YedYZ molybdopterin-dependent catalytic subunit